MKYFITSKISDNIHSTPEGFLVCIGVPIARTGEMIYAKGEIPIEADGDGRIVVHREEEEVFRPETIASFEGKSITIQHPEEFVSPNNWAELSKGILQNVRRGDGEFKDDLIADLLITDSMAIALVKNGLREVSCGYEADFFQTEIGRGVQKDIVGNHLALVDKGRAGSAYAIMDHKGKGETKMTLKERMKAVFAKAQDEAMKMADEAEGKEKDKADGKDAKSEDAMAMDQLVKMCADMSAKIDAMSKSKDASAAPAEKKKEDEKVDDEGEEAAAASTEKSMEERMKALEMAVAKLLEGQSESTDEEGEEMVGDEDEEAEDDDFEESTMTGDTASRIEILAPGMKAAGKDAKAKALKAAWGTKDGKKVIEAVTGGKAPAYDSAEKVDMLFIAASELMKHERKSEMSKSKQTRDSGFDNAPAAMTAERMNEINAKHYKRA